MRLGNRESGCNKIFNIGFHKTGTTSLTHFMRDNNYRVLHNTAYTMERLGLGLQKDVGKEDGEPAIWEPIIEAKRLHQLVLEFDFFSDNPWPLLYKLLDNKYPESKFILTRRPVDSWINSLIKYTGTQNTRMRELIYGYGNPKNHITRYRKVYIKHNLDVLRHFADRDILLVIDIEDNNKLIADKLAGFLEIAHYNHPFPTVNKI